ncbi:hypothetical protein H257_05143 [Aphanomyces astaci]|uniref:Uncharacterized protein n=1 Tax=Aphanomyces astaci TaxID=112090 RepID=W4GU55_APHAT|nr:hypothetical protein H257_05143 [Aphanomyces astaci]ETV82539.1 hypothetical protein H257_05143 [Aphanomyces astaci]|eukprot:XP_009828208.1 hypothetical protein H257_05143 [Aphanomyces astaci]
MDNYVHVDEKWFYLTKVNRRYYVYDDEEVAARTVKSKHFITKVMFLAAVARPRFDPHTRRVFDGKIGVWPFVEVVAAKRTSVNRDKGTLVTVPLSVNAVVEFCSKKKRSKEEIEKIIRQVPHHDRQTLRSLAKKSSILKTTIVR